MTHSSDALEPGTRLEEFTIEQVLGTGGFGLTYLARDESLEVSRAMKEYLPWYIASRREDGRVGPRSEADADDFHWGKGSFVSRARGLAKVRHPHVVQVHRLFESRGTAYLVMDHEEGRTLDAEVEEAGPLAEERLRPILATLTDAVAALHGAGLWHMHIKPRKIVIRRDGTPALLVSSITSGSGAGRRGTDTQPAVASPPFAPIELYQAKGRHGPWTDIYGLGALAYWVLSGLEPDEAPDRVAEDRLAPLEEVAPEPVSAELAAAVMAALAVRDTDRPQSLEAWRSMLAPRRRWWGR